MTCHHIISLTYTAFYTGVMIQVYISVGWCLLVYLVLIKLPISSVCDITTQ